MIIPIWMGVAAVTPGVLAGAYVWSRFTGYIKHKGGRPPNVGKGLGSIGDEAVQATRLVRYGVVSALRRDPFLGSNLGPTVVCVHGYTMNGSNFRALRTALFACGRSSRAVSLGWPGRPVAAYAPGLAEALGAVEGPLDIVAHSMGGVVLRVVLKAHPEIACRVRRIATLGTPHHGTAGARGWLMRWLPEPSDLHRRSPFLAELPHLTALAPQAEVLTVGGAVDLVVYPPETTMAPGARHLVLPVGHLGLVVDPAVAAQVAAWLNSPHAPTARGDEAAPLRPD